MASKKAKAKDRKGEKLANVETKSSEHNHAETAALHQLTNITAFPRQYDMFELRATPNMGIGAFATSAMTAGTSFFKETPIMSFLKPDFLITEREVATAYNKLSAHDKKLFDEARHDRSHSPKCPCKRGVVSANNFSGHTFPISSRFNHSCAPNIAMVAALKGNYQTFRTLKDVALGEELTFNYTSGVAYLSTVQRKYELSSGFYGFQCLCTLCQQPSSQRLASDIRRVLLRSLTFWLRKRDVPDVSPCPALLQSKPDPSLLRQGVYTLLYALLMEAEGIKDDPGAYLGYAYTALHVLNISFHYDVLRISPRVVQEMRMWMRKSEESVLLQYGDLSEGQEDWQYIREAMVPACVPDNGELNWVNLMEVSRNTEKRGMRFFSSIKPGHEQPEDIARRRLWDVMRS